MNKARYWETPDELTTIAVCSEGCIHLRVSRAVIKLTREEFFALTKLATTATRERQLAELPLAQPSMTGH
jgi:hypothetical protein